VTKEVVEKYTEEDLANVRSSQGEVEVVVPPSPQKASFNFFDGKKTTMATPPLSDAGEQKPKQKTPSKPSPLKKDSSAQVQKKLFKFNPASVGRPLSAVLGKENKAARKPKPKTTNKKTLQPMVVINSRPMFSATKPIERPLVKAENKPLSPSNKDNILPLPRYSSTEGSPAPSTPPGTSWNTQETISPTGSVPRGMAKLLN
jgi:hypothetical protein